MSDSSTQRPHTYVLTAAADFRAAALDEVRRADRSLRRLLEADDEIVVVESALDLAAMHEALAGREPIFLRHIVPAQGRVALGGAAANDLSELARATLELPELAALGPDDTFSVQARVIAALGAERPYSPYAIRAAIAPLVGEATGASEEVRTPQLVISVLALPAIGFVGLSPVEFNRSDWAGGARRFAREAGQVSRAEFKLLEALEVFGVTLPPGGTALDLGAAPGGWTRVLRRAGLTVTALDPAELHPLLVRDGGVTVIRGYAQPWVAQAKGEGRKWDVIVNDMRMDARDAARFMVEVAPLMVPASVALVTLKLPPVGTPGLDPIAIARQALDELRSRFRTVRARQLFHNRNEITVFLKV